MDTKEFIREAKLKHGNTYDYSETVYVNHRTKVPIICRTHGKFWQNSSTHRYGSGCPQCSGRARLTTEEFINRARKNLGDIHDYSRTEYVLYDVPVIIICRKHGEFKQTPHEHLRGKKGCPVCQPKRRGYRKNPNSDNPLSSSDKKITAGEFIKKNKFMGNLLIR